MSNPNAEIQITGRATEQNGTGVKFSAGADFDPLALHRDGAAMRTPTVVADSSLTQAIYRPNESPAHVQKADFSIDLNIGVAPYGWGPRYDYGYRRQPDVVCYPPRYYGEPSYCVPVRPVYPQYHRRDDWYWEQQRHREWERRHHRW